MSLRPRNTHAAIACLAGGVVLLSRLYARKRGGRASAGRQTTDVLLSLLAERHAALGEHLDGVTALCRAVAGHMGLRPEDTVSLLEAAALHDVGKAAIPDEILNKTTALDGDEWSCMRRHTLIGERIMRAAPVLAESARLVRSSHEWFDGGGYPDGLAGAEIPLGARIIAVCDAYDAMVSDRPYRSAMSRQGAVEELRRTAGSQFDPQVVETVLAALRRGTTRVFT